MAERIPEVAALSFPLDLTPDADESWIRRSGTESSGLWRSVTISGVFEWLLSLVIESGLSRELSRVKGRSSGLERCLLSRLSSSVCSLPTDDRLCFCSAPGDGTEGPGEPKRGKEC